MIIGIDLGTTNSLAAIWRDGQAQLIPNAMGDDLTPSCVSLDEDGSILVGCAARERLQTHPDRSAALFKRQMGSDRTFQLGNRAFRAEDLSSFVLRSLKADAEALLGETVTEAIITVPAYFSDSQRKATRIAGQLAGLKVDRLVNEPTAAALAHGLHQDQDATQFLVFDLGGGTFDVSILEMFEGVMEVRATAGDNYLGGEDFVDAIVKLFLRESGVPAVSADSPAFMQHLLARAEAAKRVLSESAETVVKANWDAQEYALAFDQFRFQQLCEPLLARLRIPVERALRDARIRTGDIDSVVLAGGATRMPMVRHLVTRMFGRFPAAGLNPDEVVAAGAAVMAGLKMKDAALDEVVMTDVCPYTLGTSVGHEGRYSPIIERNTVVPVSRVETYVPGADFRKTMTIDVYQGESRLVKDNIKLGELVFPLPRLRKEEAGVDVRFTYDVNGLLEVEATVRHSGDTHRLVIQSNSGVLTDEEVRARLSELALLKIHPRDNAENRALIAQAERCYQQLLGDERNHLAVEIGRFERELDSQDARRAGEARVRLRDAIRRIEAAPVFDPDF
ncbi:molecular chaperone HscC [Paraburkholderia sediminicola]|uniref:Hsp70 family protein n=1 Tax=Paraburkholderia sediminicola TaxID=458836 RepID=UPI0038B72B88